MVTNHPKQDQGVAAEVEPAYGLAHSRVGALVDFAKQSTFITMLALDSIRSTVNMGTILRSAVASGVMDGIVITPGTAELVS